MLQDEMEMLKMLKVLGSPQIPVHALELMISKARFSQLLPLHTYCIIHVHKTLLKELYKC